MTVVWGVLGTVLGGLLLTFILRPHDTRNRLNRFRWWVIDGVRRRDVQRCPECGSDDPELIDVNLGTAYRMGGRITVETASLRCRECTHRWTETREAEVD